MWGLHFFKNIALTIYRRVPSNDMTKFFLQFVFHERFIVYVVKAFIGLYELNASLWINAKSIFHLIV